jgi:hypothetical protein
MSQASKLRKSVQTELRSASIRKDTSARSMKRPRLNVMVQVTKKQKTSVEEDFVATEEPVYPTESVEEVQRHQIQPFDRPGPGAPEAKDVLEKLAAAEDEVERLRQELSEKNAQLFNLNRKRSEDAVKAQEKEAMMTSTLSEEKRKFNEVRAEFNAYKKLEQERTEASKCESEQCKAELMASHAKVLELEQRLTQAGSVETTAQSCNTVVIVDSSSNPPVIELQLSPRKINFAEVSDLDKTIAVETNSAQKLLLTPDKRNVRESSTPPVSSAKKSEYALALEEQIKEVELRRKKERENKTPMDYFPFGKPGGGAPLNSSNVTFIRSACISPSLVKQASQ